MTTRNPRRHDAKHLQFVRGLPCIRCADNTGTEAAHIRFSDARIGKVNAGVGAKPDDRFVLPLCGAHHRLQHAGSETHFWKDGDPILWALALYSVSGDHEAGCQIIQAALRFQRGLLNAPSRDLHST